jgi:CRISPR-associated endonuclease Cas2
MSHTENKVTLVFYDISNNKFRRKIDKVLKDFGTRFQYSVFLCKLDKNEVELCREKLLEVTAAHQSLKCNSDSIVILRHMDITKLNCILGKDISSNHDTFCIF